MYISSDWFGRELRELRQRLSIEFIGISSETIDEVLLNESKTEAMLDLKEKKKLVKSLFNYIVYNLHRKTINFEINA